MAQCPKCGSENISFQREQTASIGGSKQKFKTNSGSKGCMYWIFIGFWWKPISWVIHLCTLGLFKRRNKGGITGKTVTANKTINRTMAICQDCGKTWKA